MTAKTAASGFMAAPKRAWDLFEREDFAFAREKLHGSAAQNRVTCLEPFPWLYIKSPSGMAAKFCALESADWRDTGKICTSITIKTIRNIPLPDGLRDFIG